ncbi:hypothetical protein COLO4_08072 [Corchorus olitorius]|uniref:Uncharacterized protein n=1 Tax=Corchorus olitorius TaxID=93759 RepID=A0A1R3KHM9_9ROSI|nr:hypothetical protein COLO4_08072 [Corchorus olitorius]
MPTVTGVPFAAKKTSWTLRLAIFTSDLAQMERESSKETSTRKREANKGVCKLVSSCDWHTPSAVPICYVPIYSS